mgnify:CR=1 FL=1
MSFADSLAPYSAAVIVAALGCPRQTAYAWLDGSRKPPEWQQTLFLAVIAKEAKKHNKVSLPTMTRPESSRKGGRKSS